MNRVSIRPSAAAIWAGAGCTAYPHRVAEYSEKDMDKSAAEEGTAAHWVAENMLAGGEYVDFSDYVGNPAPNGVMVTDEMAQCVEVYTDYVESLVMAPRQQWNVEQKVSVFKGVTGTVDFWTYNPESQILDVIDYKHGFRSVEPFKNWQLALYGAGILRALHDIDGHTPVKVRLTVVQPRAYTSGGPIRTWETTPSELVAMMAQATMRAAEVHNNPIARSSSECRYCPARHACPAALDAGIQLYEAATAAMPYDLEMGEMAVQYDILQRAHEQLGFLIAAYESKIKNALYAGGKVPGYSLQEKKGREEWAVSVEEVQALGAIFNVDLCPPSPMTPKQAMAKKVIDMDVIKQYTKQDSKGHDLVAVNTINAQRIFS